MSKTQLTDGTWEILGSISYNYSATKAKFQWAVSGGEKFNEEETDDNGIFRIPLNSSDKDRTIILRVTSVGYRTEEDDGKGGKKWGYSAVIADEVQAAIPATSKKAEAMASKITLDVQIGKDSEGKECHVLLIQTYDKDGLQKPFPFKVLIEGMAPIEKNTGADGSYVEYLDFAPRKRPVSVHIIGCEADLRNVKELPAIYQKSRKPGEHESAAKWLGGKF